MPRRGTSTALAALLALGAVAVPAAAAAPVAVGPGHDAAALTTDGPATSTTAATASFARPSVTAWSPIPSYAVAAHDEPITYTNGCHAWRAVTTPHPCTIVNAASARRVLLVGDSHAAHWYAAVLASAAGHGWRMLYLTKSSCPAADVDVRVYKRVLGYPQCRLWRHRALYSFAHRTWGLVDVAVVSNWNFHQVVSASGRQLTGAPLAAAWEAGMRRTLAALLHTAKQVVLLRDSPDLPGDASQAQACYRSWKQAAQTRCGAPRSRALNSALWAAEVRAAAAFPSRVTAVDLTSPVCPGGWCGPLDGRYLRFKDDNHWTQTYVRVHFGPLVDRLLVPAMARANPPAVVVRPARRVPA